ncbi:MAG: hypothetical protein KGP27_00685 [Hyphomicrobiales bacterium]|nr:hypothetical protein [Hyphomicrobiales bacterium]
MVRNFDREAIGTTCADAPAPARHRYNGQTGKTIGRAGDLPVRPNMRNETGDQRFEN